MQGVLRACLAAMLMRFQIARGQNGFLLGRFSGQNRQVHDRTATCAMDVPAEIADCLDAPR